MRRRRSIRRPAGQNRPVLAEDRPVPESDKIYIIGVGDDGLDGLTEAARKLITGAALLVGSERTLGSLPPSKAERMVLGGDLDPAVRRLEQHRTGNAVVVMSGDPLFYGISRFLGDRLGKDRFEVVPHVSSMQLAFARVKESWDEAYLTNLANHPVEHVVERIRTAEKVGLFTTEVTPPSQVATELLRRGIDYYTGYVCENLGSPDERVTQGELKEIAAMEFAPLNVMILLRKPNVPDRPVESIGKRLFGNPDETFLQSRPKKGLLTPAEVRVLALAAMDLARRSVVWDIGAGSGSVAIEAAQIASEGTTYAIEMDAEDHGLIVSNAERFGVGNLRPILGRAPEAWADLPDPDAVFMGGMGREIGHVVEGAYTRLRKGGRFVANIGSIENLSDVTSVLQRLAGEVNVTMLNLARGTHQLERIRFDALNPSFLISAVKPS
jgi:precorrin-6B C5,15-methyltransferase / cobalt-precorrin-6B C5,C15-methyltransferase